MGWAPPSTVMVFVVSGMLPFTFSTLELLLTVVSSVDEPSPLLLHATASSTRLTIVAFFMILQNNDFFQHRQLIR